MKRRVVLYMFALVFSTACVDKPEPWSPNGNGDIMADARSRSADGNVELTPADVRNVEDTALAPADVSDGLDQVMTDIADTGALPDTIEPMDLAAVDLTDVPFDLSPDVDDVAGEVADSTVESVCDPACDEAETCILGTCQPDYCAEGLQAFGCCFDGILLWCEDYKLHWEDCADKGGCGWQDGQYACGGEGQDPDGLPLACCQADCSNKECGTDGCWFDCGDCSGKGLCNPSCEGGTCVEHKGSEVCDGIDNDCDGTTDPEDAAGCTPHFKDVDDDGYGTADVKCLCAPTGFYRALAAGDCDDLSKDVHPDAVESCNGVDDDCDEAIDPQDSAECTNYWQDADKDAWGKGAPKCLCEPDATYKATKDGDCNDNNQNIHPAGQVCQQDGDCDGNALDEGEECDDGNDEEADGCKTDCTIAEMQVYSGGQEQLNPAVAARPDGGLVVAWSPKPSQLHNIKAMTFDAQGDKLNEVTVTEVSESESITPRVAVGTDGSFWVAMNSILLDGGAKTIRVARYGADDSPKTGLIKATTYSTTPLAPHVAAAPNNNALIIWHDVNGSTNSNVRLAVFSDDGDLVAGQFEPPSDGPGYRANTSLACGKTMCLAVWTESASNASAGSVVGLMLGFDGTPLSSVEEIAAAGEKTDVVSLGNNAFLVGWSDDAINAFRGRKVTGSGFTLGSPSTLVDNVLGPADLRLASNPTAGLLAAAWWDGTNPDYNVKARRFSTAGLPLNETVTVNQVYHSYATRMDAAVFDSGAYTVVFQAWGGLYLQRFAADDTRLYH